MINKTLSTIGVVLWFLTRTSASAADLSEWRLMQPLCPPGTNHVAYANGKFYATTAFVGAYVSTNGENWNRILDLPAFWGVPLVARAVNGKVYFGFQGGAGAWLDRNGDWQASQPPEGAATIYDLLFDGTRYIGLSYFAADDAKRFVFSTDGLTWTSQPTGTLEAINSVAQGGGATVAVGAAGRVLIKSGAANWEALNTGFTNTLHKIVWGNGLFVALDTFSPALFTSPDGRTWTKRILPAKRGTLQEAAIGNGGFVVTGQSTVTYSTNGVDWTAAILPKVKLGPGYGYVSGVAFGQGRFVARSDLAVTLISSNTTDWRIIETSPFAFSHYDAIDFGKGYFAAASSSFRTNDPSALSYSTNGLNLEGTPMQNKYKAVAHSPSLWVAAGSNIVYSANGTTYQVGDPAAGLMFNDVTFGNSGFVAVGTALKSSVSGTAWTTRDSGTVQTLFSVTFGGDKYVAVGANSTVLSSTDTTNWFVAQIETGQNLRGVAEGNGIFVACGDSGAIFTSADALTWIARNSGTTNDLTRVRFAFGEFISIGSRGTIIHSPNGVTWSQTSPQTVETLRDLVVTPWGVEIVGDWGTIIRSPYLGARVSLSANRFANSLFDFIAQGPATFTHRVEFVDQLGGTNWQLLQQSTANGVEQITDGSAASFTRFYRSRLVDQNADTW